MIVAGVILAAGCSSRMGKQKQALPLSGNSLLQLAVDAALGSGCQRVHVVLGSGHSELARLVAGERTRLVVNPQWERGMGTSICAGVLAAVAEEPFPDAVLAMLADQPLVDASALRRLLCVAGDGAFDIVASEYGGGVGVPALFHKSQFEALLNLAPGEGAKRLMMDRATRVLRVSMPEAEMDIDTPEDYERFRRERGGQHV